MLSSQVHTGFLQELCYNGGVSVIWGALSACGKEDDSHGSDESNLLFRC